MKHILLIYSIGISISWVTLHITNFFKYDLWSIIIPCGWFIIVCYTFDGLEKFIQEMRE